MDEAKCKSLKEELGAQSQPPVVPIQQFFDGNDDTASIGCNLPEHPGMETFRDILTGLLKRPDVDAVYAQIAEIDPGEGYWPFTDTIFVVGGIAVEALHEALAPLEPDDVWVGDDSNIPLAIRLEHKGRAMVAWWD